MATAPVQLPLSVRTAYAELVERAWLEPFDLFHSHATGRFVCKPQAESSQSYWWFRYLPAKSRLERDVYVGPDNEEMRRSVAVWQESQEAARDRARVVRMLRSAHLPGPDNAAGKLVEALARAQLFRNGGLLVGTHAFQTYPALLGYRVAAGSLRTGDVDVAAEDPATMAISSGPQGNLMQVLHRVDPSFREAPGLERDGRNNVYIGPSSGLRLELLAANTGRETDRLYRLPRLDARARPFRFLDFLLKDSIEAAVLHGPGVPVRVPEPVRYAIHKLIVAQRRTANSHKSPKDISQAEAVIEMVLDGGDTEHLATVLVEAVDRGRHWLHDVAAGVTSLHPRVREPLLDAVADLVGTDDQRLLALKRA